MAGPHSGPYETQDPNKPPEVVDAEAAYAYAQLRRGEKTAAEIAREMGISRSTLFNRINEIKSIIGLPDLGLARSLHFDRLEELYLRTVTLLDGEISNADSGRLIAEARQVLTRQGALLKLDVAETVDPELGEDVEDHDWEAEDAS